MSTFRINVGVVLVAITTAVAGCSPDGNSQPKRREPSEDIVVHKVDPSFVYGTDHNDLDTLAATVVTDVQNYWAATFPATFGKQWHHLDGGFFSVDTTDTSAPLPPCVADMAALDGNAYYCPAVDAVVWDRAALLPVLREHYGAVAVVVVLAHEIGHAVDHRLGRTQRGVLGEVVADCYAGAYMRWVVDGHSRYLRLTESQLDGAMLAVSNFRNAVATSTESVHVGAMGRLAAFQSGYRHGPLRCSRISPGSYVSVSSALELAVEHSNQPIETVLKRHRANLDAYFGDVVATHGQHWDAPKTHLQLAEVNYEVGDQAAATVLASRYAAAALSQLGLPVAGDEMACLIGGYTRSLTSQGQLRPSANDLDEAVTVVLKRDIAKPLTGFDAVAAFRTGLQGGASACDLGMSEQGAGQ